MPRSISEAMAHFCWSLLQALEDSSTEDEAVVTCRLPTHLAYNITYHLLTFGEAPDNFLNLSVTLWRLARQQRAAAKGTIEKKNHAIVDATRPLKKRCIL